MNTLNKTLIALSLAAVASVSTAADTFYIDVDGLQSTYGVGPAGSSSYDGSVCATCSVEASQMGFHYDSFTTITLDSTTGIIGGAVDTTGGFNYKGAAFNVNDVNLGPTGTDGTYVDNHISNLLPSSPSAGLEVDPARIDWGIGLWGLGFTLNLTGTVLDFDPGVRLDIEYTSGIIEVFAILTGPTANDGHLVAVNIFDLTVTGSRIEPLNFEVDGHVSTGGLYAENTDFADFFNMMGVDCAGDPSFIALAGCVPAADVNFVLDQNLDNPNVDGSGITGGPGNWGGTATLAGDHNGSISFNAQVPEPAPLALISLGLFAIGFARIARSKKS